MQIATGFAADCLEYLGPIEDSISRSSNRVSFTARVSFWRNADGDICGELKSSPPRVLAPSRQSVQFVVEADDDGSFRLSSEGGSGG